MRSDEAAAEPGNGRAALLGVALRSQPVDTAASGQPLVDLGLGLEALDVPDLDARAVRFDLPVILGDAMHLEGDAGRFGLGHAPNMRRIGPNG